MSGKATQQFNISFNQLPTIQTVTDHKKLNTGRFLARSSSSRAQVDGSRISPSFREISASQNSALSGNSTAVPSLIAKLLMERSNQP